MTEKALFTALAEIIEIPNEGKDANINPYLTVAKFIFADDKGAPLSTATATGMQGIEVEDFDQIIKTALDMPVKMNLIGESAANHVGSYVIGHMRKMEKVSEDGINKLVAEAVLYNEEYPEEVNYLKKAYADGEAPGISYEIAYGNSIIKEGVEWIKNVITCAATFVGSPAYGNRTSLLALASAKNNKEFVQTMKTLVAQAEGTPTPSNKGGTNVDELEKAQKEALEFKAEAETKTAEIAKLTETLTAKDDEIATLKETIAQNEREKVLSTRMGRFTEAGFALEANAEKADKKKAFWLSLSDEAFDEYLEDLVSAKGSNKEPTDEEKKLAAASSRSTLPRPDLDANPSNGLSFSFRD
jgi:hypothetical protein